MPDTELAELLRELEQTLLSLKAAEDASRRQLLLRKMSRLIAQIDHDSVALKRTGLKQLWCLGK